MEEKLFKMEHIYILVNSNWNFVHLEEHSTIAYTGEYLKISSYISVEKISKKKIDVE